MNGVHVNVYSKARNGDARVADNFRVREFACKDGSDTVFVSPELAKVLQEIRNHFGKPVTINSGYRTESYNKKIGGAAYSQHKYGTAADIMVSGTAPRDVARYAETVLGSWGGIGLYAGFVHVDVRNTKARWDQRSGKQVAVSGF